jgi:hypothetical protein
MRHQSAPLPAALVAALLTAALSPTALAAPTWYGATGGFVANAADNSLTVPDFYQHQNWVSDGTPYTFNPDGSPKSSPTNPTNGWETDSASVDGDPAGWCNYVAYSDIFYDFYARGYTTVLPNAAVNPITNPYTAMYGASTKATDVAQSDIFQLRTSLGNPNVASSVQKYLTAQNTGLLSNILTVGNGVLKDTTGAATTTGNLYYKDPANGKLLATGFSAFDATNLLMKSLDADIVYKILAGTTPATTNANGQGRWWGNFHNVAVAGINTATSTVYVADPDSNNGPTTAFGGWPTENANFPANVPFSLTSPVGSPRPVPAAPAFAAPASYNTFYDNFQFGAGATAKNSVTSTDAPQYTGTVLSTVGYVMPNPVTALIKTIKNTVNKLSPPTDEETEFHLDLPTGTDAVDKIIIEPSSPSVDPTQEPSFDFLTVPSDPNSTWSDHEDAADPFGNTLTDEAIEYDLSGADPLTAGEAVTLDIGTATDFSTSGYDILLHFAGDSSDEWLPEQFGGTDFDPSDTMTDQSVLTPEPTSLTLLALGTLTLATRKKPRPS